MYFIENGFWRQIQIPKSLVRILLASGLALIINIVLFGCLPLFEQGEGKRSDLEAVIPVHLVQILPEKPQPRQKEEKLPKPRLIEKAIAKPIPTVRLEPKSPANPEIRIEMPSLGFEINPRLTMGMAVARPPAQSPTIQAIREFYEQGEVDQIPMVIFKVEPVYPYRAKRLKIKGDLRVRFLVDKNGYVSKIQILKATPAGVFEESVFRALSSWRFSPGKVRGQAVCTWVVTTIEFRMEE